MNPGEDPLASESVQDLINYTQSIQNGTHDPDLDTTHQPRAKPKPQLNTIETSKTKKTDKTQLSSKRPSITVSSGGDTAQPRGSLEKQHADLQKQMQHYHLKKKELGLKHIQNNDTLKRINEVLNMSGDYKDPNGTPLNEILGELSVYLDHEIAQLGGKRTSYQGEEKADMAEQVERERERQIQSKINEKQDRELKKRIKAKRHAKRVAEKAGLKLKPDAELDKAGPGESDDESDGDFSDGSAVSEIKIVKKNMAVSKLLRDNDMDKISLLEKGELESQISEIVIGSDFDIDDEGDFSASLKKQSSVGVDSVYNVFWEEYESKQEKQRRQDEATNNDPMILLQKLEQYSKNQYEGVALSTKEEWLFQIEQHLAKGLTPLSKYYKELKDQFKLPSKDLMEYDKNHFMKILTKLKKAHAQDMRNIKKKAETKARELFDRLMAAAKETIQYEMMKLVEQFDHLTRTLYKKDLALSELHHMLQKQDQELQECRAIMREFMDIEYQNEVDDNTKPITSLSLNEQEKLSKKVKLKKKEKLTHPKGEDPLLHMTQFQFYGSYLGMNQKYRQHLIERDLLNKYKGYIEDMDYMLQIQESQYKASQIMNQKGTKEIESQKNQIQQFEGEVAKLKFKIKDVQENAEKQADLQLKNFVRERQELVIQNNLQKSILCEELKLREVIMEKQQANIVKMTDEIKYVKSVLTIPRLHFQYLEKVKLENVKAQQQEIQTQAVEVIKKQDHEKELERKPWLKAQLPQRRSSTTTPKNHSSLPMISPTQLKIKQRRKDAAFRNVKHLEHNISINTGVLNLPKSLQGKFNRGFVSANNSPKNLDTQCASSFWNLHQQTKYSTSPDTEVTSPMNLSINESRVAFAPIQLSHKPSGFIKGRLIHNASARYPVIDGINPVPSFANSSFN